MGCVLEKGGLAGGSAMRSKTLAGTRAVDTGSCDGGDDNLVCFSTASRIDVLGAGGARRGLAGLTDLGVL